jgi:hypothetical protein
MGAKPHRVAKLLSILALSACGFSGDRSDATSRSIFTDPSLASWTLGTEPLLEIGGLDEREGYALGSVVGAALLRDHLAIADRTFGEVRFYSPSGELTARSGRHGGGPGEYRILSRMASYDDSTVVAWDWQLRRLTRLAMNGNTLATIAADLDSAENMAPTLLGVLDGGHFIFQDSRPARSLREEITGERRDSIRYLILEPDGTWNGHRWSEPGTEAYFTNENSGWGSTPVIFGRSTMAAVAGASVVVGTNDTLRLTLHASNGSILHTATLPWTPTPVTGDWVERERQRIHDEVQGSVNPELWLQVAGPEVLTRHYKNNEARIRKLPHRPTLPAFSDLRADADGNIWVAQSSPPGASERTWIILDFLLEPSARIDVPLNLEILHLRGDRLVALTKDELGRQAVAVYAILR